MKKHIVFSFVFILSLILLGSFGPKVSAYDSGCNGAGPYSTTTGQLCSTTVTTPTECAPGDNFSYVTGLPCSGNTTTPTLTITSPQNNGSYSTSVPFIMWTNSIPISANANYLVVLTSVSNPGQKWTANLTSTQAHNCGNASGTSYCYPVLSLDNNIFTQGGTYTAVVTNLQNHAFDSVTFSVTSTTLPPGCTSTSGYSTTTGVSCGGTTNSTPTISGVSGPQTLNVNQQGTWTVNASDPSNGNLSYSVNWGDEPSLLCGMFACTANTNQPYPSQQSATFTHSYAFAKTFTPRFTVTNSAGLTALTSLSVVVGNGTTTTPTITVTSPNGGEVWHPGETHRITWTASNLDHVMLYVDGMPATGSGATLVLNSGVSISASQGYYDWKIPSTSGSNFRVRIDGFPLSTSNYDTGDSISDSSNAPFSIVSGTTVTAPVITSLSPATVENGGTFVIYGTGFLFSSQVQIGTSLIPGVNNTNNGTALVVTVPSNFTPGNYSVSVKNGSTISNSMTLNVFSLSPITSSSLSVSKNTAFVNQTYSVNSVNQKVGSYVLTAGNAERINVAIINVSINTGNFFQNLHLIAEGSNQPFGNTIATPGVGSNSFTGSLNVPPGGSVIVDAYADILSSATGSASTQILSCQGVGVVSNVFDTCSGVPLVGQTISISGTSTSSSPTITTQPTNETVTAGGTVSFSVSATGTPTLTYLWQYYNTIQGWKNWPATAVDYATGSTATATNVLLASNGLPIRVVVTDGNGLTTTSNTVTLTVTSATNNTPILSVAKNTAFGDQTANPNTAGVKIGSYIIQNQSTSESIHIPSLAIALSDYVPLTDFSNLRTSETSGVGSIPVQPKPLNTFNVNFTLAPGATKTIDIFADVGTSTGVNLQTTLVVNAFGATSNVSYPQNGNGTGINGQTITINAGSLSTPTLLISDTTSSQYIATGNTSGTSNATKADFNFVSSGGTSTITELKFSANGTSGAATSVMVTNVSAPVVNGVAYLTGLNIPIPNGGAGAEVVAYVSYAPVGMNGVPSGSTASIALTTVKYQSGGNVASLTNLSVTSPVMTLVASQPTSLNLNPSTVPFNTATNILVGSVTVSANTAGPIAIVQIPLTISITGGTDLGFPKITDANNIVLQSNTPCAVAASNPLTTNCMLTFSSGSHYTISAGQSQTFKVYESVSGPLSSGATISLTLGSSSSFLWNDISGSSTANLNGILIYNYPTNSVTVNYSGTTQ